MMDNRQIIGKLRDCVKGLLDVVLERLTGMVWWPRNRDPRIRGPQPRLITIEQAEAMERHRKEMGIRAVMARSLVVIAGELLVICIKL